MSRSGRGGWTVRASPRGGRSSGPGGCAEKQDKEARSDDDSWIRCQEMKGGGSRKQKPSQGPGTSPCQTIIPIIIARRGNVNCSPWSVEFEVPLNTRQVGLNGGKGRGGGRGWKGGRVEGWGTRSMATFPAGVVRYGTSSGCRAEHSRVQISCPQIMKILPGNLRAALLMGHLGYSEAGESF